LIKLVWMSPPKPFGIWTETIVTTPGCGHRPCRIQHTSPRGRTARLRCFQLKPPLDDHPQAPHDTKWSTVIDAFRCQIGREALLCARVMMLLRMVAKIASPIGCQANHGGLTPPRATQCRGFVTSARFHKPRTAPFRLRLCCGADAMPTLEK
jgi:hypothetical protein